MRVVVTTDCVSEPATTSEAKAHLRVTGTAEDAMIGRMVTAARKQAERFTEASLFTRTLTLWLDLDEAGPLLTGGVGLPYPWGVMYGKGLRLPRGPVASVTSVTTYADDGSSTVVNAAAYTLSGDRLAPSEDPAAPSFPSDLRARDAVAVEYVAGPTAYAEDVVDAVLEMVADRYASRGANVVGTVSSRIPSTARDYLAAHRRFTL